MVSTSTIASMFDITSRRARQLVEEGIIDRVKNGSFELVPSVKKYILYLKTKNDNTDDRSPETLKIIEQVKHEAAKREMSEIKLRLMKGNIHNASDVQQVMTDMLINFKSKIRSVSIKAAAQIRSNMTTSQISDVISREVDETLVELSEYDPAQFYSEEYTDQEDENDEVADNNDT